MSIRQNWRLLREEPFACHPRQDTDTSGTEKRTDSRTYHGVERNWNILHPQSTWELLLTEHLATALTKEKAKTAARNNVLSKHANSKWGTHPSTIKTTARALCYSAAEYACPVWERSAHAHKVDPVLNDACRAITGCLQPTNVENLYLLAGIAPPAVRRSVTAQREREKQVNDNRHPLHGQNLPRKRLKSRNKLHTCHRLTDPEPIHSQIGTVV